MSDLQNLESIEDRIEQLYQVALDTNYYGGNAPWLKQRVLEIIRDTKAAFRNANTEGCIGPWEAYNLAQAEALAEGTWLLRYALFCVWKAIEISRLPEDEYLYGLSTVRA